MGVAAEGYGLGVKRHIVFVACLEDETDSEFCNGGFDDIFDEGDLWKEMRDDPMANPNGLSAFELNLQSTMANVSHFYDLQTYGQMTIEHHYIPQIFTLTAADHQATKQTCINADIIGTALTKVKEKFEMNKASYMVPVEVRLSEERRTAGAKRRLYTAAQ